MENTSEALFSLQPAAFHYKKEIDPTRTLQWGLVAEDVEHVHPDLIVRDNEGKPYSVRYDQINAMLLNEFLKEHKKVQQQEATISKLQADAAKQHASMAELKKTLENVLARLNEHDTKIQKVSIEAKLSKSSQQNVASD